MLKLNPLEAAFLIQQHANGMCIVPENVAELLGELRGSTFASITQVTPVPCAAAHKGVDVRKVTVANVQLFNNLSAFTNAYENAVKRSAAKLGQDEEKVAQFESQGNWFHHTADCYSVVKHNEREDFYLFAIYNHAQSEYFVNGAPATKEQVAAYLTPSAAKKLLEPEEVVHNATYDISHTVTVRTVKLENIVRIQAMGEAVEV